MRVSGSFCARCGARLGPGAYFCPRCGTGIPVAPANAPTVATAPPPPHDAGREALLDALRQAALGEYEILAELGRGGMATVYLAHDVALDRKVAIKVLAPALLQMGEGMVERFKREARTAAALSHPHIIPIYAVKESERSEEHTSELQSRQYLVCRLLLEKKKHQRQNSSDQQVAYSHPI